MLDINGGELVVLVVLAVLLIGPERLPRYAAQLGALVRRGKVLLVDAKSRVDAELGPEFKDVDWSKLDPRQYDPRRIVRDALLDDAPVPSNGQAAVGAAAAASAAGTTSAARPMQSGPSVPSVPSVPPAGAPAPFDDEAT